jgi:hypothetical protein
MLFFADMIINNVEIHDKDKLFSDPRAHSF